MPRIGKAAEERRGFCPPVYYKKIEEIEVKPASSKFKIYIS